MKRTALILVASVVGMVACGGAETPAEDSFVTRPVPSEPQRTGNPDAGYRVLVNGAYITCGLPYSAYAQVAGATGPVPDALRLPGREGHNAELPYGLTAVRTASGVEVVNGNCLSCHAGMINGHLVIGLGNASGDFTDDVGTTARLAGNFVHDPVERQEWEKWSGRMAAVGAYTQMLTRGPNPADNLAAVLFAHHDPRTLAWSDVPVVPIPPASSVPVAAVDVPPWWRMRKKNAMFYNALGRGDHARIMMTATVACTDTVEEARRIDSWFPDVNAYITSLRPPAYPFTVDMARAARGRTVFEATCSRCHGTYGEHESYPNLLVGLGEIGTDDLVARGSAFAAAPAVDWFNRSFYGERSRLQPSLGYVAPPLDGIWATAPYLHNGSVPTIAALLNSPTRPRYWTRSFDSRDYDPDTLGWRFTALDHGQAGVTDSTMRTQIYDTTLRGYANTGHLYGDALSNDDRTAVIEYLKTL